MVPYKEDSSNDEYIRNIPSPEVIVISSNDEEEVNETKTLNVDDGSHY